MTLTIDPTWQRFIDDQVKAGRFRSEREVVEAGLARLMLDEGQDVLDEQDLRDLQKSHAEIERGELIDGDEFHAQLLKRFGRE